MTTCVMREYFPFVMSRWQHTGAFVVQFGPKTEVAADQWVGRVEHVATTRGVQFDSLAELLGFIERILADSQGNQKVGRLLGVNTDQS